MTFNCIKLVTFDVTNTLLKFRTPPYNYYAVVARSHGFKGSGVDIKNQLLNSYKELTKQYPNFGRDSITWNQWWNRVIEMTFQGHLPADAKIDLLSEKLIEDFKTSKCWEVTEGGVELIKLLKRLRITVGVISNFDPRLHNILANLCINDCFDFVLTSYEVGVCKPDKIIFECAQANYGKTISSEECLHIGDDLEKDYNGAKAAGWNALLITDRSVESNSVNSYSNFKELHKAIESKTIQQL